MAKAPKTAPRRKLRVVNITTIVTSDGDVIVSGTPGTLLHWNREYDVGLVVVRWDAYMFVDEIDDDNANTHEGLVWPVAPDNLRYLPDVHETQSHGTLL